MDLQFFYNIPNSSHSSAILHIHQFVFDIRVETLLPCLEYTGIGSIREEVVPIWLFDYIIECSPRYVPVEPVIPYIYHTTHSLYLIKILDIYHCIVYARIFTSISSSSMTSFPCGITMFIWNCVAAHGSDIEMPVSSN